MSTLIETPLLSRPATPFSKAEFCWVPDFPPARNQFVSFELRLRLSAPGDAALHLFADSRYRLFVNERFIAYGPGRFVTAHPEFDTHAIGSALVIGSNLIRVEVNYYGSLSFQTMPDGRPGFIADGGTADGRISFATPGVWRSRIHRAWDSQAPHFSFAQNPAEICDTRTFAAELAFAKTLPLLPLPADEIPWPKPAQRSVPYPDYALLRPARLATAGPLAASQRWGIQLHRDSSATKENPPHIRFATWIQSPRVQTLTMGCFWADICLDGQSLEIRYPKFLGNHGEATVALRKGWNFLSGNLALLLEHWPLLLDFPPAAGLSLRALPSTDCAEVFALSPLTASRGVLPPPLSPSGFALPADWRIVPNDLASVTPARLTAWDQVEAVQAVRDVPAMQFSRVSTITAAAALWNFDFGDEYYGQPVIEVEAPAGSILDVAYDDWRRADGCVNLYHSNPFTDAADRFILSGGRQRIDVLNPRGGIFLQLVLRAPGGAPAKLTVHDVALRRRTTLNERAGHFFSGDALLDWAWDISTRTLQRSTDEAYADCPWRERGSYIGDSLVNFHLHRLITDDLSVTRRTFAAFGQAQRADGQLACCAPSWLIKPHEDFTLIWVLAVRDFWAYTGDTDFAAAQLPVIRRIFASPTWNLDADGLADTTGKRVFIDWGVDVKEREGSANAVVNILRIAALRATAELCSAHDLDDEAARLRGQADQVARALIARIWDDAEGRFRASEGAITSAVHANILALRFGIGPSARILRYLEPRLRANFHTGTTHGRGSGYAELYFFHYLLPALVAHDRVELAESMIRETYGFLRALGYPTLVECFHRAAEGRGSCCHSWSGSPAIYATEYVLGLRLAEPGNPRAYVLDPVETGRDHAEGSLPLSDGLLHVRWTRQPDGRLSAHATVPPGVTLIPASHVDLNLTPADAGVPA